MTSARTVHRLNRLLAMLPWVIANPGATVEEVCDRFGYTQRQLVEDLDTVFVCGLPGYGPGDLMVAYIDEDEVVVEMADYFDRPVRLTAPEALGLLAAGRAILSAGQGSAALDRAVEKLEDVLLPEGEGSLIVDLREPDLVGRLRSAAAEGRVVRIEHSAVATGDVTVRDVEPWTVFSTLGNWYVSGFCRLAHAERVFRIDRIRLAEETGERFEPPSDPPPPEVRYTPSVGDVRATIRLTEASRWVADYYPVDVLEDDDGHMVIAMSVSDPIVAARLLVRLGTDATLLSGDEVAAATAELRRRIAARYHSPAGSTG
jgi:proteasome accessory factor C